jgi:hypothetical protein
MVCSPRILYPDAFCHEIARVHAWVLMSNHYPRFIKTPAPDLAESMKW